MTLSDFSFEEIGPTLSKEELINFEQEIGGSFDEDLKAFLLKVNGGLARPILESNLAGLQFEISAFLSLDAGYCQMRRAYFDLEESFDEEGPKLTKVLPFALDYGDGALCVRVGATHSPVLYVPTISALGDDDIQLEIIEVASSFRHFVESLCPRT